MRGRPAEDTHGGTETLSGSGRLHVSTGENVQPTLSYQLFEPTRGPYFLSGPLVYPTISEFHALLTCLSALIWGNGRRAEEEHIEICLDGASPQVGGGGRAGGVSRALNEVCSWWPPLQPRKEFSSGGVACSELQLPWTRPEAIQLQAGGGCERKTPIWQENGQL